MTFPRITFIEMIKFVKMYNFKNQTLPICNFTRFEEQCPKGRNGKQTRPLKLQTSLEFRGLGV